MKAYTSFAKLYDKMMDNIPYEEWEQYILCLLYRYGIDLDATITELGCGTGSMTELLAEEGFNMTGLDLSEDMLDVARAKSEENHSHVYYMHGDMRNFQLTAKQDVILSICDSVNYLLSVEDLKKTFEAVKRNLKEDGIFIFDLKTRYFFESAYDGRVFKDHGKNFKCTWENRFDKAEGIHHYLLSMKTKEAGKWVESHEEHLQRVFTAAEIKEAALAAGFTSASAFDAFTFDKPKICSQRIYIVLKNS